MGVSQVRRIRNEGPIVHERVGRWAPACAGVTEFGVIPAKAGIQETHVVRRFKTSLAAQPWP